MKESFCEILLDYLPSVSELEDFYLTTIANCVLNSLLSYIAIMLNIAKIHAVRKTSSLPQVLSHSSPSQIPGTCDSQACCGCGDLNVDVKYNWSFFNIFVPLDIYSRIMVVLGVLGVILTTTVFVRIYFAVRRHKNQIQVLQVRQVTQ